MSLHSVKRESVVTEIYTQMKEQIINGEWKLGSKIPSENELSQQFEVSRNTIRSAIQHLKAINILTTVQGQGTFVVESLNENLVDSFIPSMVLSKEDILEILEFRQTVEMGSVMLACKRASKKEIEQIRQSLEGMVKNRKDYKVFSLADYQFHLNIAKASGNKIFTMVMVKLEEVLYKHFVEMNRDLGPEMSLQNHEKIFKAIENSEAENAAIFMRENIEKSIKKLEGQLQIKK